MVVSQQHLLRLHDVDMALAQLCLNLQMRQTRGETGWSSLASLAFWSHSRPSFASTTFGAANAQLQMDLQAETCALVSALLCSMVVRVGRGQ